MGGKREGEKYLFKKSRSKPPEQTDIRPQEPHAAGLFSATTVCSNPECWEASCQAAASPSRPGWVLSHSYLHDWRKFQPERGRGAGSRAQIDHTSHSKQILWVTRETFLSFTLWIQSVTKSRKFYSSFFHQIIFSILTATPSVKALIFSWLKYSWIPYFQSWLEYLFWKHKPYHTDLLLKNPQVLVFSR